MNQIFSVAEARSASLYGGNTNTDLVTYSTQFSVAKAIHHNSDYRSVDDCKAALDKYFAARNETYRRNPRRAGKKIWGKELVKPCFTQSNNCKDPNWRGWPNLFPACGFDT